MRHKGIRHEGINKPGTNDETLGWDREKQTHNDHQRGGKEERIVGEMQTIKTKDKENKRRE